ncbi:MAG: GDSL family lipase [Armatimonadetes bacterium]|nr:GDSL family lipase [Armatimonadota bacterium]
MFGLSLLALAPLVNCALDLAWVQGAAIPKHVATTPVPRSGEAWWVQRHQGCVETTKRNDFEVAFLGDSITQGWEGAGKAAWTRDFAPLKAANFGFSGDRTEHVLWRLANGELVGTNVKLIVIMIGTNNVGHGSSSPTQTADGVKAIVQTLLAGTKAKILLLGIFPRDANAGDRLRQAVSEATRGFQGLHDGARVHYKDVGHFFVRPDGTLRSTLMPDLLHLNPDGYEIWAKAMLPDLKGLLGKGGQ